MNKLGLRLLASTSAARAVVCTDLANRSPWIPYPAESGAFLSRS